jgi:hypothetical protein
MFATDGEFWGGCFVNSWRELGRGRINFLFHIAFDFLNLLNLLSAGAAVNDILPRADGVIPNNTPISLACFKLRSRMAK